MNISDLSPHFDTTTSVFGGDYQSVSGRATCIACSPNGQRVYLGGNSGVWRSEDGGVTWAHCEWPQPPRSTANVPGALDVTNVYDLLVSPQDPRIVLAATGRDYRRPERSGIHRSVDGGRTWAQTHQFPETSNNPRLVGSLAVAPDDADLMYAGGTAAVGLSTDAGATWAERQPQAFTGQGVFHVVVGPEQNRQRRVYAAGSRVWFSLDGGDSWQEDPQAPSVGPPQDAVGASSRALALHPSNPRVVYLRRTEQLWRGEFPQDGGPGAWTMLASPPIGYPGTTASGCDFVIAHEAADGTLLLFVSDRRTTHVTEGEPTSEDDYRRIDGGNVHIDPHGMALSQGAGRPGPSGMGRIHLVSDGGAYVSTDGAQSWTQGKGLSTLGLVNASVASVSGKPRGVCIQMGDNSGYYSRDGGQTWETQDYVGGDNDCTFVDPRQPDRLVVFAPRAGRREVFLYVHPDGEVPDGRFGTNQRKTVKGPPPPDEDSKSMWIVVSSFYGKGYRPLVLTPADEEPRPDGDFVTIWNQPDRALLLRTTAMSSLDSPEDWVTTATAEGPGVKVFQQGPDLPASVDVVQASGGHVRPTFFVHESGGSRRVWSWRRGEDSWRQLVPAADAGPSRAVRFYVDPFRPNLLYVLDDHVYRTDDGGRRWTVDDALERVLTRDSFSLQQRGGDAALRDMAFDPRNSGYRFAVGPAGVFATLDGREWFHLALSSALAAQCNNLFYDPGDSPCDRALYVSTSARGLLRLHPLPPEWDTTIGSVNATLGHVTLLRVHDVGTGYGPPADHLDAEVIVHLDTQPDKAFGFRLRGGRDELAARAQLDLLREAFNSNRRIRIEYTRTGCRAGEILRVIMPA